MPWLALGILLLGAFLLLVRWLANAEPSALARRVRIAGITSFFMLAALTVVLGRPALAIPLVFAALGFVMPRRIAAATGSANGGNSRARSGGGMSVEEALNVLGLRPGAKPDEIRAAHKRLMLKTHPDHGGSDYLAAKINEAKDVLLGRK